MTNEEQKEVLRLFDSGMKRTEIMKKTGISRFHVYNTVHKFRGEQIQSMAMSRGNAPIPKYGNGDLKQFRDNLKIGDKFKVTKTEIDDNHRMVRFTNIVTVIGIYPFVADCDKGSYTYGDLIKAERVVEDAV